MHLGLATMEGSASPILSRTGQKAVEGPRDVVSVMGTGKGHHSRADGTRCQPKLPRTQRQLVKITNDWKLSQ